MSRTVQESEVIKEVQQYKSDDKIKDIYLKGEMLVVDTINGSSSINIFEIPDSDIHSIIDIDYLTADDQSELRIAESQIEYKWNDKYQGFEVDIREDSTGEYTCLYFGDLGEVKLNRITRDNEGSIINYKFDKADDLQDYIVKNKYYNKDGNIRVVGENKLENHFQHNMDYITYRDSFLIDNIYSLFMIFTFVPQVISMILIDVFNLLSGRNIDSSKVPIFTTYIFIYLLSYVTYIFNSGVLIDKTETVEDTIERTYEDMDANL